MPPQLAPLLKVNLTFALSSYFSFIKATPSLVIHPRDVPLLADPTLTVEIQVDIFYFLLHSQAGLATRNEQLQKLNER